MTINSVAQEISDTGYGSPGLRDEVYIQLCKQVSDNPRRESLRRGWELLGEFYIISTICVKVKTYLSTNANPMFHHCLDLHSFLLFMNRKSY